MKKNAYKQNENIYKHFLLDVSKTIFIFSNITN